MFENSDLTKYLEDLKYLVSIDSPTGHIKGINEIINFFTKNAQELGLKAIRKNYNTEEADCLLITNAEDEENIEILMLAHMDTVYEVGVAKKRPLTINGNKALGAGVIDDKGGALLGLYALKKIDLSQIKIGLLLNSNEEKGSKGNHIFIEEIAKKSKYCLVLEATRENGACVDKRFGVATYKISFSGTPATVHNFKDGMSPIYEVCKFIKTFEMMNNNNLGSLINPVILETPIPDLNSIQKDIHIGLQVRFADERFFDNVQTKIEQQLSRMPNNVSMSVEQVSFYPCMPQTFKQKELKRMVETAGNRNGISILWETSFGGSDGCYASRIETCMVVDGMGPLGGNFHKEDEYLDISTVEPKCNIIIDIANQIIKIKHLQIQKDMQAEKHRLGKITKELALKEKELEEPTKDKENEPK
jgi:glutamate carboxypeptidase